MSAFGYQRPALSVLPIVRIVCQVCILVYPLMRIASHSPRHGLYAKITDGSNIPTLLAMELARCCVGARLLSTLPVWSGVAAALCAMLALRFWHSPRSCGYQILASCLHPGISAWLKGHDQWIGFHGHDDAIGALPFGGHDTRNARPGLVQMRHNFLAVKPIH